MKEHKVIWLCELPRTVGLNQVNIIFKTKQKSYYFTHSGQYYYHLLSTNCLSGTVNHYLFQVPVKILGGPKHWFYCPKDKPQPLSNVKKLQTMLNSTTWMKNFIKSRLFPCGLLQCFFLKFFLLDFYPRVCCNSSSSIFHSGFWACMHTQLVWFCRCSI